MNVIWKLILESRRANQLEEMLIDVSDKPLARDILLMFNDDFMNKTYVERILCNEEVTMTRSVAPRKSGFNGLSDCAKRDASSVMAQIAVKIAQLLFPQHDEKGSGELLQAMVANPIVAWFVLPDVGVNSFDLWCNHPVLIQIKNPHENIAVTCK